MTQWAVEIVGMTEYFRATLYVETPNDSEEEARAGAQQVLNGLRHTYQMGPTAVYYDSLMPTNITKLCA